jgi:hypothetical protein
MKYLHLIQYNNNTNNIWQTIVFVHFTFYVWVAPAAIKPVAFGVGNALLYLPSRTAPHI